MNTMKAQTQQEKINIRVEGYRQRGAAVNVADHYGTEVFVVKDEDGCVADWFPTQSKDCDPTWMMD